jgi:hypothetical protein
MKIIFVAMAICAPVLAAGNSYSFVDECREASITRLKVKAEAQGAVMDEKTLAVDQIDDRWYNPSKYVWFKVNAVKPDGTVVNLTEMLQKSFIPPRKCGQLDKFNAPKSSTYIDECKEAAISKLKKIAEAQGATLEQNTVAVSEIDDRWYNPYKYVWFKADGKARDGRKIELTTMTQKSFFPARKCGDLAKASGSAASPSSIKETTQPL